MVERATSQTLLGILSNIKRPKRFLLEKFFPSEQTFTTQEVVFGKIIASKRLAPFVSPYVKGKPMPLGGEVLTAFKPPYVKPKHVLDASIAIKALPGESLSVTPTTSLSDRIDRLRVQILATQDDMITRREEWMASSLLRTGAMTIVAEDHPTQVVTLGRPAAHTVALLTTARWGETGVSPFNDIKAWALTVATASGFTPTEVVLDPLAAALLTKDPTLVANFGIFHQPNRSFDLLGQLAVPDEAQFMGSLGGFNFWQYQTLYMDAAGAMQKMIPDHTVIMGSPVGGEGVRAYGAIMDLDSLEARSRFPKEFKEDDPSAHFLMTQSAPLPLIPRPEATIAATVR